MNQKAIVNMIRAISGQANVLTIPRLYITLTKSHRAALLLSQCIYWSDRSQHRNGWFYKTYQDWKTELGIPRRGIDTALKHISKWVETDTRRVGPTPKKHYRVRLDLLVSDISDLLESDKSEMLESDKSEMLVKSKSTYTEITTKTPAVDSATAALFAHWESHIGLITPIIREDIERALTEYPPEWIIEAINVAVRAGDRKRNPSYVTAILARWKRDGFKADWKPARKSIEPVEREVPIYT